MAKWGAQSSSAIYYRTVSTLANYGQNITELGFQWLEDKNYYNLMVLLLAVQYNILGTFFKNTVPDLSKRDSNE